MHLFRGLAASLRTRSVFNSGINRHGRGARRARRASASAVLSRAAAEALEGRVLLSLSAQIRGPPTVAEGGTYTVNLLATGSESTSIRDWTINKGDGTAPIVVAPNPANVATATAGT